jgi:hypothetical protein
VAAELIRFNNNLPNSLCTTWIGGQFQVPAQANKTNGLAVRFERMQTATLLVQ